MLLLTAPMLLVLASCENNPVNRADTSPPVIQLTPFTDTVYVGDTWKEPGYLCLDETDGDLSGSVSITGSVDTESIGTYTLSYTVSDAAGNSAVAERTIQVRAAPSLLASYQFNGSSKDQGPRGLNGTVSGPVLTTDRFGNADAAYSFDGVDDYIAVESIASLPEGNVPKSLSGWFKSSEPPSNRLFFGFGTAAEKGNFQVGSSTIIDGDDEFTVNGWGAVNDWKTGIPAKSWFNGKWHHCAVTYDTKTTILYLDGKKIAQSDAFVYNTNAQNGKIVIGMEIDLKGWAFKGDLDDFQIFNHVLTPLQVKALFRYNNWAPEDSPASDTATNTQKAVVTGLKSTISGTLGHLSLLLEWEAVPGAFSYGVYFESGPVITDNYLYRVAISNSRTFTTELVEGKQYSFAVTAFYRGGGESARSAPLTVVFEP